MYMFYKYLNNDKDYDVLSIIYIINTDNYYTYFYYV